MVELSIGAACSMLWTSCNATSASSYATPNCRWIVWTCCLLSTVGGRAFRTCSERRKKAREGSFAQICTFSLIRSHALLTFISRSGWQFRPRQWPQRGLNPWPLSPTPNPLQEGWWNRSGYSPGQILSFWSENWLVAVEIFWTIFWYYCYLALSWHLSWILQ